MPALGGRMYDGKKRGGREREKGGMRIRFGIFFFDERFDIRLKIPLTDRNYIC